MQCEINPPLRGARLAQKVAILTLFTALLQWVVPRCTIHPRHCATHTVACSKRRPRGSGAQRWYRKAPMAEERIIRKYANRRLYDATSSRHVTLDDIRKMIAAGDRIKV